ncbi:hypothetical protein CF336_g7123 [Tilletia laevis]|nr:hypothetical protein CF336_g7123 [Tilletia laevis]
MAFALSSVLTGLVFLLLGLLCLCFLIGFFPRHVLSPHEVALWSIPLELAILLRIITARFNHPLVVHAYFVIRPAVFFAVTLPFGFSLARLQSSGRVFDIGRAAHAPFWRFYTYFDLTQTSSMALVATMPTQFALVFLSVLHPPLNIPALAVNVGQDDVNTDRELTAHGWSNIIADAHVLIPALCFFIAGKYLQA